MSDLIKPSEQTRVIMGSQVWLHFSVALENGNPIDSTFESGDPVNLTMGDGNLLPGFERVLMGLQAGDKRTAVLGPEEAFGEHNPDNIQRIDANLFMAGDGLPEVGVLMEFEDKSKATLPGLVTEVSDTEVVVDFNHPLAGKTVVFQVEVAKVLPPGSSSISL